MQVQPVSHMVDEFSELGDHERFVVDSTALNVEETTETVLKLLLEKVSVLES